MVACFPDELVRLLNEKSPPETTHTLVLWTKNPTNLIEHEKLRECCVRYPLYVHFTITGIGDTHLEPNVPPWEAMASARAPSAIGAKDCCRTAGCSMADRGGVMRATCSPVVTSDQIGHCILRASGHRYFKPSIERRLRKGCHLFHMVKHPR